MEEPDEDSSRAVHAFAARRKVVGGVNELGGKKEKEIPKLV